MGVQQQMALCRYLGAAAGQQQQQQQQQEEEVAVHNQPWRHGCISVCECDDGTAELMMMSWWGKGSGPAVT